MNAPATATIQTVEEFRDSHLDVLPDEPDAIVTPQPYAIWTPSQFFSYEEPPEDRIILPAFLCHATITALIGPAGLGKSRLSVYLSICQIIGKPWCGLEVCKTPKKWLLLGDENGPARLKNDLEHLALGLTKAESELVEQFLRLPVILGDGSDFNLGDPANRARFVATVKEHSPDVVVIDPLQSFLPGDLSKPGDMSSGLQLLIKATREAAPRAAILILHHARPGTANITQAVGYNAGNYGSGGKSLLAKSRAVFNLAPGKSDDDTRLVLACGKASNCVKFETRGIVLDTRTFNYQVDPEFDQEAWLEDVETNGKGDGSACTVFDVVELVRDGTIQTGDIKRKLIKLHGISGPTAERLIRKTGDVKGIEPVVRGKWKLGAKAQRILNHQ